MVGGEGYRWLKQRSGLRQGAHIATTTLYYSDGKSVREDECYGICRWYNCFGWERDVHDGLGYRGCGLWNMFYGKS